ncbi:elongation of very long chain fatty acids protein 4-like isoform X1 [Eriocheir sinensis]|uniref:elongation of very long chain fatty acids protein 4-like isoform X1 n=1 Tax=Eriocheir sinensis TaxID=95602 RepID=UPI0021CA3C0F|nr:elongation of very long chain fatty acids protein 4-like isoform X1 [Eriocheir sinensis]
MEVVQEKMHRLKDLYDWGLTIAVTHFLPSRPDDRVKGWPLMSSPLPTLGITAAYLIMVKLGPRLMAQRPPFQLKIPLIVYNLAIMLLNLYIGVELAIVSVRLQYSWFCQPVDYSTNPDEMRIAAALWWYYVSKLVEFMDTLFFILRKKTNQLTFLHIYHHSTMFCLWWIGIKWVAGGSSFLAAMMNSFVHVVMYAYYGLSALGPSMQKYLWWKKHITCIQLIQFTSAGVLGARAIVVGCDFPLWMQYALVVYMSSFIVLFGQFYVQAYRLKQKKLKGSKNGTAGQHGGSNGIAHNGVPSARQQHQANGVVRQDGQAHKEGSGRRSGGNSGGQRGGQRGGNARTRAQLRREGRARHDS